MKKANCIYKNEDCPICPRKKKVSEMTNEQILYKAIEKAEKGGYTPWWWEEELSVIKKIEIDLNGFIIWLGDKYEDDEQKDWDKYTLNIFQIIFSHGFAKAFWGEGLVENANLIMQYQWQYHLQQMVISEEPLKYIEKFL